MEVSDVVQDLALEGSAHFHASYVAKQLDIPTEEAHKCLAALQQKGIVEINFDVICPETDRTIKTYKLHEEVPLGEMFIEQTGDCEPFELTESDLLVTYSPTPDYIRRLLRDGKAHRSKKKTPVWKRLLRIFSPRPRSTDPTNRDRSTSTSRMSARSKRMSYRHHLAVQQWPAAKEIRLR
jgi:hypothetical protein